jgi:hypothetical protein
MLKTPEMIGIMFEGFWVRVWILRWSKKPPSDNVTSATSKVDFV